MFKKRGIPVELDRKRFLRLELEGMVAFEVYTGKPIFLPSTMEKIKPKEIVILLWACLMHEGLSLEEVGEIYNGLDKERIDELAKKLPIAWQKGRR